MHNMRLVPDLTKAINSATNRAVWLTIPFDLVITETAILIGYRYLLKFEDVVIINKINIPSEIINTILLDGITIVKSI